MPRTLIVAAAQTGSVEQDEPVGQIVSRLIDLLYSAHARGARLVVFPELALTPFFPYAFIEDDRELDTYFHRSMPDDATRPLFQAAAELGVAFNLGYAELAEGSEGPVRFNSSILVGPDGTIVSRYRKIHLPGFMEPNPDHPFCMLEKRYFEVGDIDLPVAELLGAQIGLCICNDRRWPEVYRTLRRGGGEVVLLGYNTPTHNPLLPEADHLIGFHNHLNLQAGALQNGLWVVATAKAGRSFGVEQIAGSCIVSPSGEIVAQAATNQDEVVTAAIDLDLAQRYQQRSFTVFADPQPHTYR